MRIKTNEHMNQRFPKAYYFADFTESGKTFLEPQVCRSVISSTVAIPRYRWAGYLASIPFKI